MSRYKHRTGPRSRPVKGAPTRARARPAADPAARFALGGYDRMRQLPKLIPLWPSQIEDPGADAARSIVRMLARALRAERTRARAGHWTYDLNRHVELVRAYRAEIARLEALQTALSHDRANAAPSARQCRPYSAGSGQAADASAS